MQLAASAPLGALRSHSKASVQVYRRQVADKTQIIRALRAPSCDQEVCRLAFGNRLASRLPNQVDSGSHENTGFLNLNGPRGCSASRRVVYAARAINAWCNSCVTSKRRGSNSAYLPRLYVKSIEKRGSNFKVSFRIYNLP